MYDTEGVTAFFVNEVESHLMDILDEGNSIEESVAILQQQKCYSDALIHESQNHLKSEGVCVIPEIPYQHFSQTYTLTLNVTQECNLRCRYCYVKKRDHSFMSETIAEKALDFLFSFEDMEGFGISFYGGEPLLNFPVVKFIIEYTSREAEKRGLPEVKYHITTNGTLLTDEIISFLADYHINVMVSIDGPASIHDAVRVTPAGEKTHALVLNRLQKLMSTSGNHKVSVSGVVTNQGQLRPAYDYLSRLSLTDIKLSYVQHLDKSEYALTDSQKKQYKEDMRYIALKSLELLLKGSRPPYYEFENKILQLWKHTKRLYFCPAGVRRFGISPDGGIYPCGPAAAMDEWKLGYLDSGINKKAVDKWRVISSFENTSSCKTCWARYLCAGGCPLRLVRQADEKRCEMNKHATKLAIALYAAVKEENEVMLAALVDEEFLSHIKRMIQETL